MKGHLTAFAGFGLIAAALGSAAPPATAVERNQPNPRAAEPTAAGDIGIKPPPINEIKGSVGPYRPLLRVQDPNMPGYGFKWIGPDPDYIKIITKTITDATTSADAPITTSVATMTQGVAATKNAAGGLDVLLSPRVIEKIEAIVKKVPPCPAKRELRFERRGGACGLEAFVDEVGSDDELREIFSDQFTDQARGQVDEGYEGEPGENGGSEGDGGSAEGDGDIPTDDEGYASEESDADGFSEVAEGAEEGSEVAETLETVVFASEAEAATIAQLAGISEEGAIFGAATVTAGSFLAMIWNSASSDKGLDPVYQMPKESIHKITKTKTKSDSPKTTEASSTTSSEASCPTGDPYPECGSDCEPTSTKLSGPEVTGMVDWICTKGEIKDCKCNPAVNRATHPYDEELQNAFMDAVDKITEPQEPPKPNTTCPFPLSEVPSKFIDDITKSFCPVAMDEMGNGYGPAIYDIDGNKVAILKSRSTGLQRRTPPENSDMFSKYRFSLQYAHKDGECITKTDALCADAYDILRKSECGTNAGPKSDRLFAHAAIDVGCGEFSWEVIAPS